MSQISLIPWAKNKSLVIFFGLWLLTGLKAAIAQERGLPSFQSSVGKSETLKINLQGNRLRIEANQIGWHELLTTLKEKTHIAFYGIIPLKSAVTVTIPDLPVTEALQQLFSHRFDFVLQFSGQNTHNTAAPKAVWLLGNAIENVAQAGQLNIKKTNDKPNSGLNPYKTAVYEVLAAEGRENETIQELMDKARSNDNPEVRLQALASLSGQEQPDEIATKLVLETALEDKDSRVREYAVQALASQDGREANEYLREALNDPDADVRMRAVESVGLEGQGIELLHEALSNADELIQTIAEERLKQVKQ